jgi:hypothetical protein
MVLAGIRVPGHVLLAQTGCVLSGENNRRV